MSISSNFSFQMASPDDNTAVIRMKREFQSFMGTSKDISASYNRGDSMNTLSFDLDATNASMMSDHSHVHPVPMQRILDKEKEERSRQADLLKVKAEVSRLKMQLNSEITSRKKMIVDHEKEVQNFKQEIQVEQDRLGGLKSK